VDQSDHDVGPGEQAIVQHGNDVADPVLARRSEGKTLRSRSMKVRSPPQELNSSPVSVAY
jgi:hypothetical protein